jgi:methionyl aminopeptidase
MPIELKSPKELDAMRAAGRIVAEILQDMSEYARPGVTTGELNDRAHNILSKYGATSPFFGYPNSKPKEPSFPGDICASVNDEIVHGIPRAKRVLREGDLLKIDVGAEYGGFIADSAWTFAIGQVSPVAQRLMKVTESSLAKGLAEAHPGRHLWDVIRAVQTEIESNGFTVIREYQGHGVGRDMHEEPGIPNFLDEDYHKRPPNVLMRTGMTLAIEPMVVTGNWRTRQLPDKWTVSTRDRGLAAHYEHTVAITENGPEILTQWK